MRKIKYNPKKKAKLTHCFLCNADLKRNQQAIISHFKKMHGRSPTEGEVHQIIKFQKTRTPYSEDFIKPKNEVSGGGFSPK